MTEPGIEIVCFDLGGVVVRIPQSWEEACAAAGLPAHASAIEPPVRQRLDEVANEYQLGRISHQEFVLRSSQATEGLYSSAQVQLLHDAWLLGEYPGMEELIGRLNHSGRIRTACLSNTEDGHWTQLLAGNGRMQFPAFLAIRHKFASHLMGISKPNPLIYKRFEEEMGVAGGRILFFDDRQENLAAARELGWMAEWIDPGGDPARTVGQTLVELGIPI